MSRKIQQELDLQNEKSMIGKPFGGGSHQQSHPKAKRPFSRRHLIHLILKSSQAKGSRSFLHKNNSPRVNQLVRRQARLNGIQLNDYVNVGNHLHLLIKCAHRRQLIRFVRAVTGLIPRIILNCERGNPLPKSFWDGRPFTKILALGRRTFLVIRKYFAKNRIQANRRQSQKYVEGFDFAAAPATG
ncbi:MAG: transposase [Bdellovibrionales bacterium]|nr:transposase [Bdellovibrionales bacterium]